MSKVYGVLVGVEEYRNDKVGNAKPLIGPANDIDRAYELLLLTWPNAEFQLLVNEDATLVGIREAIEKICSKITHEDTFILMFCGHGWAINDPQLGAVAIFLSADFNGETVPNTMPAGGFTLEKVAAWLGTGTSPKNIIVILDCCCSGVYIGGSSESEGIELNSPHAGTTVRTLSRALEEGLDPKDVHPEGTLETWPRDANVVVLAATSGAGLAFEDPRTGHGIFSQIFLSWWENEFMEKSRVNDLERAFLPYAEDKIEAMKQEAMYTNLEYQMPCSVKRNRISFGDDTFSKREPISGDFAVAQGLLPLSSEFGGNLETEQELRRLLSAEGASELGRNVVFCGLPFSNKTSTIAKVVYSMLEAGLLRDEQILYLGAEYEEVALPAIFAYVNRSRRWADVMKLAMEGPITDRTHEGMIASLVKYLSEIHALVVLAYRSHMQRPACQRFLELCAKSESIRLCLIVDCFQELPYEVSLGQVEVIFNKRESATPRFAVAMDLPSDLGFSPRMKDLYPTLKYRLALQRLLEHLDANPPENWTEAFDLLKAFSLTRFPRTQRMVDELVRHLGYGKIGSSELIRLLTKYDLVYKGSSSKLGEEVYFVHALVKQCVKSQMLEECSKVAYLHKAIAKSYSCIAPDESSGFPERCAVWIHEAIDHWIRAEIWDEAAQWLIKYWDTLVDAGYQRIVLNWVDTVKRNVDDIRKVELLLEEQSLRRHRQEWDEFFSISHMIKHIYKKVLQETSLSSGEKCRIAKFYWKSRYNIATYYFIRRDYVRALKIYGHCLRNMMKDMDHIEGCCLSCDCMIRAAHCHVLSGDMKRAQITLRKAELLISRLPEEKKKGKLAHKRTVEVEKALMSEDHNTLYGLALAAWSQSLRGGCSEYYKNVFSLAIARINMAWACLMRCEYLRAWRHCIRARQMLNSRGVPEYWWICQAELIAGLAIAWSFCPRIGRSIACQHQRSRAHLLAQEHFLTGQLSTENSILQVQSQHLESLVPICQRQDSWRAAEVLSALGQLIGFTSRRKTQKKRGIALLNKALSMARKANHRLLMGYVLEALAALSQDASYALGCSKQSCYIGASLDLPLPVLRRSIICLSLLSELCHNRRLTAKRSDLWHEALSWLANARSWQSKVGDIWDIGELSRLAGELRATGERYGFDGVRDLVVPCSQRLSIDPNRNGLLPSSTETQYPCRLPCALETNSLSIPCETIWITSKTVTLLCRSRPSCFPKKATTVEVASHDQDCHLVLNPDSDDPGETRLHSVDRMQLFQVGKVLDEYSGYCEDGFRWRIVCELKDNLTLADELFWTESFDTNRLQ